MQQRAKQHLQALLLRHGKLYPGKRPWTKTYDRWLETVAFEQPLQQIVFQESVAAFISWLSHLQENALARSIWLAG
jgi:hypothetical protein